MFGIIGAMDAEINEIKKLMTNVSVIEISSLTFYRGNLANNQVVLVKSGIGKTLSALSSTIMAINFDLDYVINVGSAGAINSKLKPLDVIVSDLVAQGDFDLTAFGYKQAFSEKKISFQACSKLINTVKSLNLNNVYIGDMVSSDTFISNQKQAQKILDNFPTALCVDMEAGSIAMVLEHFKIPFIVIRSISDVVGSKADNVLEFNEYLKQASQQSALITKKLIENY